MPYKIMHEQAGSRYIGIMERAKTRLSSHYANRGEFLVRLKEKNEEAKQWGEEQWRDVSPIRINK